MNEILVVGSIAMDTVVTLNRFPKAGETVIGNDIAFYPGGKGANQCIAIRRLGGNVQMCGMVGKDANGEILRQLFANEGVPTHFIFEGQKPTGMAQIQINEEGENSICIIPSANHEFSLRELDAIDSALQNAALLVLQLELTVEITEVLIRRANSYGVPVLLNPAPAAKLSPEVMAMVSYLTPNETELSFLADMPVETVEDAERAAQRLLAQGVKTVVATLGSQGALAVTPRQTILAEGFAVKAVDTVAAGDSFSGGLAVALTEGKALPEALRFANAVGALTVCGKGAIPSLPKRERVELFLEQQTAPFR